MSNVKSKVLFPLEEGHIYNYLLAGLIEVQYNLQLQEGFPFFVEQGFLIVPKLNFVFLEESWSMKESLIL